MRVVWPDQEVTEETVVIITRRVSYNDMGHTCHAIQHLPRLRIDYHGEEALVPFGKLDITPVEGDG